MNKIVAGLLLVACLLAVYFWPVSKKSFEQLYVGGLDARVSSLNDVRSLPLKSVNIHDVSWLYLKTGVGDTTILFLHGMAGAYDVWWNQIDYFKDRYQIISVTYPAVGSLAEMGAAVMQILDQEKVGRFLVVGSSLGGYFCQYLTATYPERVIAAVYGNTFPVNDFFERENTTVATLMKILPEWTVMQAMRSNLDEKVLPACQNDPVASAYLREGLAGVTSRKQLVARYQCVIDKFQPADVGELQIPVLIIESENDPLVPEQLRAGLKALYPTARVVTYPDKGHFPYINFPTDYNRQLAAFWASVGTRAEN
jgi:pimeloyl-ACP methyl ester carboxylesterase